MGVDLCSVAVEINRKRAGELDAGEKEGASALCVPRFEFLVGGFASLEDASVQACLECHKVAVVYSRFSLHAVNRPTADAMLRWAHQRLRVGGLLFIETRSVLSNLYGVGLPGEKHRKASMHHITLD